MADHTIIVTDSITRPANTTAYAAGDVISEVTTNDHYTFTPAAPDAGLVGYIEHAVMSINANQSTLPDIELWLFHTDIAEVADNSAFAPTDAEVLTLIGVIDFPLTGWKVGLSGAGASGNIIQEIPAVGIPYRTQPASGGSIFGQLVVRNAYTPISDEIFQVRLSLTHER